MKAWKSRGQAETGEVYQPPISSPSVGGQHPGEDFEQPGRRPVQKTA